MKKSNTQLHYKKDFHLHFSMEAVSLIGNAVAEN